MNRPTILISNDDGIHAPGIHALAEALEKVANIIVIAPDRNNSGVSSKISLEDPLRAYPYKGKQNWWYVNGTPADCVKLALSGFVKEKIDFVVSGINAGHNLGDDVIYSGTVGAAMEGRFLGVPALALSCVATSGHMHYDSAAQVALELVKHMINQPIKGRYIYNVNVPNLPLEEIKGMRITRQGDRHFSEPLMHKKDGRGHDIYWLGNVGPISDKGADTDFAAIEENWVSITPLGVDMTVHKEIANSHQWLSQRQTEKKPQMVK